MDSPYLKMVLSTFFWGGTGILNRAMILNGEIATLYRIIFSIVFVTIIISYRKKWVKIHTKDIFNIILSGTFLLLQWLTFYYAIKVNGAIEEGNIAIAMIFISTTCILT